MNRPSFFAWRPATTRVLIVGLIILLVGLVTAFMATHFKPTAEVRLASGVFHLWVADTEQERIQGLSGVEKLGPNGGLLMDFAADDTWGIWMKDMKVPLDIIWLDSNKKVIYIVKDASPNLSTDVVFQPKEPARYVLELPAGTVGKAGIKTGQTATFASQEATP